MPKHYNFDKLSDKKIRLKIALQVSKLGFSPIVMQNIFAKTRNTRGSPSSFFQKIGPNIAILTLLRME